MRPGSSFCTLAVSVFALGVEGDREGDGGAERGGGYAEGLQGRHGPGFDIDCSSGGRGGGWLLGRRRDGGVDCHGEMGIDSDPIR